MFRRLFTITILACCLLFTIAAANPPASPSPVTNPAKCGTWHIERSPNPEVISFLNGVSALSPQNIWSVGGHNDFLNKHHLTLAEHWNGTKWNVTHSTNISKENELFGVSAISANDIWSVGTYQKGSTPGQSLTEHWNGATWQTIPSPNVSGKENVLAAVSAISAQDVWAVGYTEINLSNYRTLTEHWNGTSWSIVPSIDVGSVGDIFSSVVAISTNDVWAVGDATVNFSTSQTLIEHWNGTQWSVVSSPNIGTIENQLSSISALSSQDIWTVGSATDNGTGAVQTLTEHWNGTAWNLIPSPNPSGSQPPVDGLNAVATVSAQDVWAVGYQENASGTLQTLSEQWNGTKWLAVTSPNKTTGENMLKGIAHIPDSHKVVAVGLADAPDFSYTHTLIMTTC